MQAIVFIKLFVFVMNRLLSVRHERPNQAGLSLGKLLINLGISRPACMQHGSCLAASLSRRAFLLITLGIGLKNAALQYL